LVSSAVLANNIETRCQFNISMNISHLLSRASPLKEELNGLIVEIKGVEPFLLNPTSGSLFNL